MSTGRLQFVHPSFHFCLQISLCRAIPAKPSPTSTRRRHADLTNENGDCFGCEETSAAQLRHVAMHSRPDAMIYIFDYAGANVAIASCKNRNSKTDAQVFPATIFSIDNLTRNTTLALPSLPPIAWVPGRTQNFLCKYMQAICEELMLRYVSRVV